MRDESADENSAKQRAEQEKRPHPIFIRSPLPTSAIAAPRRQKITLLLGDVEAWRSSDRPVSARALAFEYVSPLSLSGPTEPRIAVLRSAVVRPSAARTLHLSRRPN